MPIRKEKQITLLARRAWCGINRRHIHLRRTAPRNGNDRPPVERWTARSEQ